VVIAKAVCGTSMAAVTLIDVERQWFKSIQGIDAAENLRSESMCGHAILQPQQIMVVEDALQDIRFHDNPVVAGDPHIRFYAGAPLISSDGLPLGTLCVFDAQPQHLAQRQGRGTGRAVAAGDAGDGAAPLRARHPEAHAGAR
jgi:GAF domain-containing protein